jgi:hypothetical protein
MPKIMKNVPKRKEMKTAFGNGVTVNDRSRMIKETGRTDASDSLIFSIRIVCVFIAFLPATKKFFDYIVSYVFETMRVL